MNRAEYSKIIHAMQEEHLNNWPDRDTPYDERTIWLIEDVILSIKPNSPWWRMGMIKHLRSAIDIIRERGETQCPKK